ncbi:hypothetical protein [Methanoculleus caldifontis]|uniref:hypothetical protein n=1 Tax=Methanoculleus caldifontis TaxID=2651577 RepID=UPI0029370ED4|nr:hypothetical protein [Methanoculleus sp. Wushi-C6]
MSEKELKIGDIAHLTGLSEQDVRELVQTYDSLFSYRTIGRVKLFPEKAVRIVRELVDLSGRGLTAEEVESEVRSVKKQAPPEEPAKEVARTAAPLPVEAVIDLRVIQETIARQERRIAHLAEELERERHLREEEAVRFRQALDRLQGRLDRQQEQLAVVAEWVDYFDRQMDEVALPALERVRRTFGKGTGRSG